MSERTYGNGAVYEEGTEGTLMAVWYAMKWATELEKKRGAWMKQNHRKWWILQKLLKALGMESRNVNYAVERAELIDFANNHGVVQHGKHPFEDLT